MTSFSHTRRQIIKASLAVPLLATLPLAQASEVNSFQIPRNMHQDIDRLFGVSADSVIRASKNQIKIKMPDIAENRDVVPMSVIGEKGLVSTFAVFAEQNMNPLVGVFKLTEGSDLAMRLRARINKSSEVYVIAQTNQGIVIGTQKLVKVTIGCGGG